MNTIALFLAHQDQPDLLAQSNKAACSKEIHMGFILLVFVHSWKNLKFLLPVA